MEKSNQSNNKMSTNHKTYERESIAVAMNAIAKSISLKIVFIITFQTIQQINWIVQTLLRQVVELNYQLRFNVQSTIELDQFFKIQF